MGKGKKKNATPAEKAHMLRVKEGVCICCLLRCAAKLLPAKWVMVGNDHSNGLYLGLLEAHHTKSGNIRRGHLLTLGLCLWHHRGKEAPPPDGYTHDMLRDRYGPSLMDGSRLFHDTYGTDDELLEVQAAYLSGELNDPVMVKAVPAIAGPIDGHIHQRWITLEQARELYD